MVTMIGRKPKNGEKDEDGYDVNDLDLTAPVTKRQARKGPPSPKRSPKPKVGKRSSAPTASPTPKSPKPKVAGKAGKRSSAPSNGVTSPRSSVKSPKPRVAGKSPAVRSPNMKSPKKVAGGVKSPKPKGSAVAKRKKAPALESPMSPVEVAESMRSVKRTAVPVSIPLPFDADDASQSSKGSKSGKGKKPRRGNQQNGAAKEKAKSQKPGYIPAHLDSSSRRVRAEKEKQKLSMSDHGARRGATTNNRITKPGYIPSTYSPPDRSALERQKLAQSEHGTSNTSNTSFRERARSAKERAARARANQSQQPPPPQQRGKPATAAKPNKQSNPGVAHGTSVVDTIKKKMTGKGGDGIGAVAMVGDDLFDSDSSDGEESFSNVHTVDRSTAAAPIEVPVAELAPNYEDVVKEVLRKQREMDMESNTAQRTEQPPTMVMGEVLAESAIPIEEPKRICGVKSVYCFILLLICLTAIVAGGLGFGISRNRGGDAEIEYVFVPWPTASPTETPPSNAPTFSNFTTESPTISPTDAILPTSTPTTEEFGYYWNLFRPFSTIGIFRRGTPQFRAVEFVADDVWVRDDTPFEVLLERFALGVLYYSTVGENWTEDSGKWLIPTDVCSSWPGVECDEDKFVTEVKRDDKIGLTGTLPLEVSALTALKSLRLTGGEIGGTIARRMFSSMSEISSLVLSRNEISGTLPSEIGLMTKLTQLVLDSNALTGSIPSEIGLLTGLKLLDLSKNSFEGEIPSEIGLLTNLISINFDQNEIEGIIPSEIGLLTTVNWLNWNSNQLTQTIPTEIGNLKNLAVLHLSDNFLSGSVPDELIAIVPKMRFLHLERNFLADDFTDGLCLEPDLPKIWADCLGDELGDNPEVVCDCCTSCCSDEQNGCVNYEETVSVGTLLHPLNGFERYHCWFLSIITAVVLCATPLML